MNHTVSSLWAAISLARRDLLEFLRDRRTVAVTLLLPMITYPLVALSSSLGVRTGLQTTAERQSATSLSLVFSGPESPRLATRLGMLLLDAKENFPPGWPSDVFAEIEPAKKAKQLLDSGKVETALKSYVADKTNWRTMLKNEVEDVDLESKKNTLLDEIPGLINEVQAIPLESEVINISYPVLEYPTKIVSLSFDKTPSISGFLQGIKGQYLLLDGGVLNLRKFSSYHLVLET